MFSHHPVNNKIVVNPLSAVDLG